MALTRGPEFNDHQLIWAKLDQVRAKYPDMVLMHGGSPDPPSVHLLHLADPKIAKDKSIRPRR